MAGQEKTPKQVVSVTISSMPAPLALSVHRKGSLPHATFLGLLPFGNAEQKVTKLEVNYSVSSLGR